MIIVVKVSLGFIILACLLYGSVQDGDQSKNKIGQYFMSVLNDVYIEKKSSS